MLDGWSSENAKINEITLHSNGTFEIWSRPAVSCFTWHEYKGTWQKSNDTITFRNEYEIAQIDVGSTFSNNPENNFYLLTFSTDDNSILNNKEIKISYVYNFDDDIDDVDKILYIDNDNVIKVPFKDIPHRKKLASIRIEYYLNGNEKRWTYLTENNTVNVKYSDLPNTINIEFVTKPKKEIVYRTIKAIQKENSLQVIYLGQTVPMLPDYSEKLNFESIYTINR